MTSIFRGAALLCVLAVASAGCGPTDLTSGGTGGGASGGGAADAGPRGGTTDGGGTTGGGGSTDGGGTTGGGGSTGGGGGSGGGGAGDLDCPGLVPSSLPARVMHIEQYSTASQPGFCDRPPVANGNGSVAMPIFVGGVHPGWRFLSPSGSSTGQVGFWRGDLFASLAGFAGYGGDPGHQTVVVEALDDSGRVSGSTQIAGEGAFAPDPNGGLFLVGRFSLSGPPPKDRVAFKTNRNGGLRYGPVPFPSNAAIFGQGVDVAGRAVVLLDGGPGRIDAVWLDENGKVATPVFNIFERFQPGPATWFETSTLVAGGLALRRMDAPSSSPSDLRRSSQWIAVLPSAQDRTDPLPDWLAQRPDTNMELARGRKAYAFLPWERDEAVCDQQIEILAVSGASCGKLDFPIDGKPCRTRELRLGSDGTVLQKLPVDREQNQPADGSVFSCTLRYWPAALK
jgi:hypothetical protein